MKAYIQVGQLDPPRPIHAQVGDYGMINNETGEFDWEGNVYTTTNDIGIDMTDPALTPIEQEGGDDKFIVKSWGVTTKEVNASAEAAVAGAVDVALKVEFQFDGRKPAVALVMYKPRYISLPNDERIIKLLKFRPDVLGKKRLGRKIHALVQAKKPRTKFWWPLSQRGNEPIDDTIPKWDDVDPPWDPLDDEGEEDEIYDAEMHGDFGVFNDGYPDLNRANLYMDK
ncbi:hypothetical protein BDR07DRAFT_1375667 [Suillus spraguei]|nr:hypothetical protein BDR07DRAFT_1375667 [Suillus spraguei]